MSFGDYGPRQPRSLTGPLLLVVIMTAALTWLAAKWWNRDLGLIDPNGIPRVVTPRGDLASDEKSTIELFRKCSPSVVNITTLQVDRFNFGFEGVPAGSGSGLVWRKDGYIVTNAHVLQNADAVRITLADGTSYTTTNAAAALDYDLAVLKIDTRGRELPEIDVGDSTELAVGQKVFAIGNPFGLDQTLTTGVISALGRQIKSLREHVIDNAIQTDAAINPGNSGGPLLDSSGRLIGVNTQIISPSGAYAGIGFAIPVNTVNEVATALIRQGRIVTPSIGASIAPDATARSIGLRSGAIILDVAPGGPAEKAGLRPLQRIPGRGYTGDVIIAIDDQPVRGKEDVNRLLSRHKVGESVTVTIRRGGKSMEVEVELVGG